MPLLQLPEVNLHYRQLEPSARTGAGLSDDVVMLHGLASSLAFWYLRFAPALADHHRVTLFDLRGHGRSSMPASGYTPLSLAEDLRALLDHLGIDAAHLVVHSFGGLVALQFARQYPQRVRSLMLVDVRVPALQHGHRMPDRRHMRRVEMLLQRLGVKLDEEHPEFGFRLLEEMARLHTQAPERARRALSGLSPFQGRGGQRAAGRWLQLLEQTRARKELLEDEKLDAHNLAPLKIPVFGLYGEFSQAQPTARALAELWPHARFRQVARAGHFFPMTRPEVVLEAMREFIPRASIH